MQVNVPGKGYAATASGYEYILFAALEAEITSHSEGGFGGGWPIDFISPSEQLGTEASNMFVKFSTVPGYIDAAVEVYMLPGKDGDMDQLIVLACTRAQLGPDAPLPRLFGFTPMPLPGMDDYGDHADYSDHHYHGEAIPGDYFAFNRSSSMHTDSQYRREDLERDYGIPDLPEECILFDADSLHWELMPDRFTVSAPPRAIFDTLEGYLWSWVEGGHHDGNVPVPPAIELKTCESCC